MTSTIIHGDCIDYMASLPDNAFELAVVDPPYNNGTNADNGTGEYAREWFKNKKKNWDNERPNEKYFIEVFRVSKNQIIFGANFFQLPPSRGWICWYKSDEIKGRDFSEMELAYSSFDIPARHYERKPFIKSGNRIHSTQKPIDLYKWLLKNYATPGDRILDTHGGSMSSVIAALDMGFEITCIEKDEDYYNAAKKRIETWNAQESAFKIPQKIIYDTIS